MFAVKKCTQKQLVPFAARYMAAVGGDPTADCVEHLNKKGIWNKNIVHNPTVAELYEYAMLPEHLYSTDPNIYKTTITDTGALHASSGLRYGRSPKDKRVVMDEVSKDTIWWGDVNIPISPQGYARNRQRTVDYLNTRPRLFVIDGYGGWDPDYRLNCRVICARPYHAIFMKQMLVRDTIDNLNDAFKKKIDFTIMNAGEFWSDPTTEDVTCETSVNVNLKARELCVLGSSYAGEMKKGLFGIMHYYMPTEYDCLSMHASANEGEAGDTTLLFGLSGTGKTTLSADPNRRLIGDDEHVWTDKGIFNIEGGCYAKCIDLSRENEPDIYDAIRFGCIVENVIYQDDNPRSIAYERVDITENTRAAYPLEHIDNVKIPAIGGHPKNIIFLTCDANGILPPVAKLTKEQIMYHFITGYTAKVAGTEMGIIDPEPSFSACFGAAFLPLHPFVYAERLADCCEKYGSDVWLMNTGWSGGPYGEGERMSIGLTRSLIDRIHDGSLTKCDYELMPGFNLHVPKNVPGVSDSSLF
jgi:phosphoenolpyruvate carboxykinase (ATP)